MNFIYQTAMRVSHYESYGVGQRLERLNDIRAGDLESRVNYLTDPNDTITEYWEVAGWLIIKGLDKVACNREDMSSYRRARDATKKMIWSIDLAASETQRYIVKALRAKQLNDSTQEALRIRWSHLDLIFNVFSGGNTLVGRKSSPW